VGEAATLTGLAAALDAGAARLRALHLACHAFVDARHPRRSGLVLAEGEILDVDAIYRMRVPADLAVLSACDTGRGGLVAGEGALGFVRAFFFAGVPRLVTSAWRVDDTSTRRLMTRFYEGVVRERQSPAVALRTAQRALLEGGGALSHPAHWAPWVLWGLPD